MRVRALVYISINLFTVVYCESVNLIGYNTVYYLTIRLWARDFYRVIVDEGAARVNYPAIEIESE